MVNKERSCFSGRESPRPPRFRPPRTSCDSGSNVKEAHLSTDHDTIVVEHSRPCFSEHAAALAHLNKACAVVAPKTKSGAEPASSSLLVPNDDEPHCRQISPVSCNADNKCNNDVDQSFAKVGSPDITGDSDTEPSYVYVKRDNSEEQISQVSTGPGTCPQSELRSGDRKDGCIVEGDIAASDATSTIAGASLMADAEEASRRASTESLYSNVRSSFSQRSEHDITSATNSPLRCTTPETDPTPVDDAARPKQNPPEEEDAEKYPGSSVAVSISVQSPMDAMAGLRRLLTFGKKNGKAGEVATTVVKGSTTAGDRSMSRGCPIGSSVKERTGSSDSNAVVATDGLDNSCVISPHGNQFFRPFPGTVVQSFTEALCMSDS
jgi:hypothetical protein